MSWFSGTEFSDSSQVPTQMGSLLKTNFGLRPGTFIFKHNDCKKTRNKTAKMEEVK